MVLSVRCWEKCFSTSLRNYGTYISTRHYSLVVYGPILQPKRLHFISFMADTHICSVTGMSRCPTMRKLLHTKNDCNFSNQRERKQFSRPMKGPLRTRMLKTSS